MNSNRLTAGLHACALQYVWFGNFGNSKCKHNHSAKNVIETAMVVEHAPAQDVSVNNDQSG